MKHLIPFLKKPPVVPVIRLQGGIGTGRNALSDAGLAPLIEKAFRMKPAAVALVINSPGGSAVQSSLIAARIRRLAGEKGRQSACLCRRRRRQRRLLAGLCGG